MQVGQSVFAATRMDAPSTANASFNKAKRASREATGATAPADSCDPATRPRGSRSDLTVMPCLVTADDNPGANTPSTNTYRAYPSIAAGKSAAVRPAPVGVPEAGGANFTFSNGRRFAYFQFSSRVVGKPSTLRVSMA